jgi:Peptidase MA superfamily
MWYIKSRMVLLASLRLLLVAVLCLPAFTFLHADSLGIINDKELVVQYDEPLKNAAREVIVLYPRIKHDLEGILGWKIDFNPSIWLIREHTRFQEMTVNPYVIAFAVPSKNLIVIDYSKMNISPFTLEVTLKHEMCHLILGNNIPDVRLPRWLNEGFCQWVTGGIAELMIDDKQPNLQKASLAHRLIPLASLNMHFPGDKNQLILAYEESKSVVDYIVTGSGPGGVVSILGHLREGDAIDEATSKSLSLTLDELEKHWIQYLQGNVTWIGYLAANIYMILLFVAALITVFGFIRIIIKRRLRASRIEEDDEEVGLN